MRWSWRLAVALTLFLLAAIGRADGKKTDPAVLVTTQKGKLPVILSALHGGQADVPGVPPCKGEGLPKGSGSGFFTARDVNTDQLALALAEAVEKKMGQKPHLVVARFSRKYIDANRPTDIAYEDPGPSRSTTPITGPWPTLARRCGRRTAAACCWTCTASRNNRPAARRQPDPVATVRSAGCRARRSKASRTDQGANP